MREVLSTPVKGRRPALVVLGSGLCYLRDPSSRGLPRWYKILDTTFPLPSSYSLRAATSAREQ